MSGVAIVLICCPLPCSVCSLLLAEVRSLELYSLLEFGRLG